MLTSSEHLHKYGYAPGGYVGKCHKCETVQFAMDKRATTCLSCATAMYEAEVLQAQEPVAEIEHEEPSDPINWKRAKLNEAGLKLPHGAKLYTTPQPPAPCPRCEQRVADLFSEQHKVDALLAENDKLQAKVAEQSAENEKTLQAIAEHVDWAFIGDLDDVVASRINERNDAVAYFAAERDALQAKVVEQSSELKDLRQLLTDVTEYVETPPDRNCSCHISPPCRDCMDNSHLRGLLEDIKTAVAVPKPSPQATDLRDAYQQVDDFHTGNYKGV